MKPKATRSWFTLPAEAAAFTRAVSEPGRLAEPVPSCPLWCLGELVAHLGAVYHRTLIKLGTAAVDEAWGPAVSPPEAPEPRDPLILDWFGRERDELLVLLAEIDPDTPAWNFSARPRTAEFWQRRMANETTVHRWDAELSRGLPDPLPAQLAADTVTEVLDTMAPARLARTGSPDGPSGLALLRAADINQQWYVRVRGTAVSLLDTDTLLDDDAHPVSAYAAGSASDLALAMWGRVPFDVLDTEGDLALLRSLAIS